VAADHRSIIPSIPGVPWWAAVVIAVTATAAGFAFDAGSGRELTTAFSGLYVLGCVAAVLAVRQSGVFTAVIQPPLILFCAVPGAYWLFHGAKFTALRDLLINCGYPLIERFPLMLFTSGGVLIIGIIRWLLAMVIRPTGTTGTPKAEADDDAEPAGFVSKLSALLSARRHESADDDNADKTTKPDSRRSRNHAVGRSARSARTARSGDSRRTTKRQTTSRSRPTRPALDEAAEPPLERPRRRRPTRTGEFDGPEPPRRGRTTRAPDLGDRPSRDIRRDPHTRETRPTRRSSRFDPYEPIEPYEPYDPGTPSEPRRRPVPNGASATHHPISQVRYRGATPPDEPRRERPRRQNYDL
jgi:uncharacterized protein DUF6542